ncbi:MAG: nuclear transport factor 2 family protein [Ferruginibacter sp.]
MNENEALINRFYSCFQRLDAAGMNACYSDDIAFYDPMFELLQGDAVKAMWEMLCKNAKDFSLGFDNIKDLGDGYYNCNWTATYTFSKTGRKVVNMCKAYMFIENGRITEHSDGWSLQKWSAQAIGIMGTLFGWAGFFRRKLKNNAKKNLMNYMEGREIGIGN